MDISSKFYSLSEELLTIIAKEFVITKVVSGDHVYFNTENHHLKLLRLSSPRFSYLKWILKTIFEVVQLEATPKHIEQISQLDASLVAPFVQSVTFLAPLNSWTCKFDDFKDEVFLQAVRLQAINDREWPLDDYEEYIEQHWIGGAPFSNEELKDGFKQYHELASAAKAYLVGKKSRVTKVAWTNAIRRMKNVRSVIFESFEVYSTFKKVFSDPSECIIRPNHHHLPRDGLCWNLAAPVGDALFTMAIKCIAGTNVKIRGLDIRCAMTSRFEWDTIAGWEKLDLSQLRIFKFWPHVTTHGVKLTRSGGEDAIAKRASDAVDAVMKKCKDSLEEFDGPAFCPMQWPGPRIVPLRNLKTLNLYNSCLTPSHFKAWMRQVPSLESLELWSTSILGGISRDWLIVFDAIRAHPRAMKVVFEAITTNDYWNPITLDYNTSEFEEWLYQEESDGTEDDLDRSLALYLSGKIEYNNTLRICLEDEEA